MFIYIVNTHGEIHNIILIWGYSLCKKLSSTIFRTSALVFRGCERMQSSPYLAFTKIDIVREGIANYETIRAEVAKLQSKACFCMALKLRMAFVLLFKKNKKQNL